MSETQSEVIEITLEQKIETDLVKANVTQAVISTLRSKYGELKLKALDDKESYLELKAAAKECSKIRNLAVKCCKAGREDAIAIQKLWVAKEKEVVAQILEVESPLDEEIAKFDAEVERLENEERIRQEEEYMHRTQSLTKMGAAYGDGTFSLGGYSIEAAMIKESSADTWNDTILPKFTVEYERIEAERIELQKKRDAEEAELRRKQEELAEQQRQFEAQQAEFKRKQEEAENERKEAERKQAEEHRAALEKRTQKRQNQLSALGMTFNFQHLAYTYEDVNVDVNTELSILSEDDWDVLVAKITPVIADRKHAAEEKRLAKIEEDRKEAIELAAKQERQRIEEENRQAEIKRQQEEQRKLEELAKAGDKAQWDHFLEQVEKISVPTFKSGQYRKIGAIANEKLEEIFSLKP